LTVIGTLKRCEVFLGLSDNDLQKVVDLPSCQEKAYDAQEIIFKAGGSSKHFYVIQEGRVNLLTEVAGSSPDHPKQSVVRAITKGGTFGWSALVPPHVRILSASARVSTKVLAIRGDELRALFDKYPHLGYEVLNSLLGVIVSRVRNIEQLLITGKGSPFFERPKTV